MAKDLISFNHPLFGQMRAMMLPDGQIGFVGKDVAKVLGYSNTRDALSKPVEEEDKTTVAICDTGSNYKTKVVVINESGLYCLVFLNVSYIYVNRRALYFFFPFLGRKHSFS